MNVFKQHVLDPTAGDTREQTACRTNEYVDGLISMDTTGSGFSLPLNFGYLLAISVFCFVFVVLVVSVRTVLGAPGDVDEAQLPHRHRQAATYEKQQSFRYVLLLLILSRSFLLVFWNVESNEETVCAYQADHRCFCSCEGC